jgi:hydrogenase expression/formation protein HypC
MCLAATGTILAIETAAAAVIAAAGGPSPADDPLWRRAEVDFGGVRQWVSLACLPEARVGDRVLVHVGLALSLVQEEP